MKLTKLIKIIEEKFPTNIAEDFDNVGLLLENDREDIKKVLVCLDVTSKAIDYAISQNVDMIISHHPLIFSPLKRLTMCDITASKVLRLARENIAVYALHTNLDSAKGGLNDYVWSLLDYPSVEIHYDETEKRPIRYYELDKEMKIQDIVYDVKDKLNIKNVKLIHNSYYTSSTIKKIALVTGSGMSFKDEVAKRADLFLTADVKHHDALDSLEMGLAIIDMGHYESEVFSVDLIKDFLSDLDLEIETYYSMPILKTI